jgi:4-aminobutyrate aminotransferase-like enzyme/Ser/Thr protein kinase RdoA (MazF antagonist)
MQFSNNDIQALAEKYYGIEATIKPLNGYEEMNYQLAAANNTKYVLKISGNNQEAGLLEAQVKMLHHLSESPVARLIPHYIKNTAGNEITKAGINNQIYCIRLLGYLEGGLWAHAGVWPEELMLQLGSTIGQMDRCLDGFFHPALCRYLEWDIANARDATEKLHFIENHEKRRLAAYFLLQFETEVTPKLKHLRKACIHNDINDFNVLVNNQQVSGFIDFGDALYTQLINNLAIACTYALFNQPDPLHAASLIVKGYHEQNALTDTELSVLYYLIAGRLCISVTKSAENLTRGHTNEHFYLSDKQAWELLFQWIGINPLKAEDAFRTACGFSSIINKGDYVLLEQERKEYVARNLSTSYGKHLKIVRGALQYLYDDRGNTFVDCVNNVSHVGHCNATVVKAIQRQAALLNTNTRYLHENMVAYAKRLTATLPPKLKVCFFTNSGSEANDLAIRLSRHYTKQQDVIVLDHAYHGTSIMAVEMSPYKFDGKGGFPQKPYIHKAANPDQYRGAYRYDDKLAGKKYAADIHRIVMALNKNETAPAAFICETLLGVGGQIPLPPGYLKEAYSIVRAAGGVCIADEVQVGFGRVGAAFWGFQLQEVEPDIVVMGKPAGNGHPLAVVVVTEEIAHAFNNGMEYFNTFGGNPVSMAAGIAVLDVIEQDELQQHALETGNYLMEGLKLLMPKHTIIGDVRGAGLFVGIELVRNRQTQEPAVPEIDAIVEKMKDRGYLLSTDGPLHNVIKIKPPMVFSKANANGLIGNLDEVLDEFAIG